MYGTSGRTRTGTLLRARDFESRVSTNSTTLAFASAHQGRRAAIIAVMMGGSTGISPRWLARGLGSVWGGGFAPKIAPQLDNHM